MENFGGPDEAKSMDLKNKTKERAKRKRNKRKNGSSVSLKWR